MTIKHNKITKMEMNVKLSNNIYYIYIYINVNYVCIYNPMQKLK